MANNNSAFFDRVDYLIREIKRLESMDVVDGPAIKQYNQEINRMLDVARKRYDRILKNGLNLAATFRKIERKGRFSLKGKKGAERNQEIRRAADFLDDANSTISGIRETLGVAKVGNNAAGLRAKINELNNINRIYDRVYNDLRKAKEVGVTYNPEVVNVQQKIDEMNVDLTQADADIEDIVERLVNESQQISDNGIEQTQVLGQNIWINRK